MKFSSSHHRFGLWWLRYLCLCSLQNIFLSLAEILPFSWIRRCLTLVCCAEGVAAIIGLVCVFSLHIAFRLPFCLWLWFFPFSDSAICFSSAAQVVWQLSLFTLSPYCLFTFSWDFSLLMSLPLFISLICCAEKAWQWSLMSGVNLPPQGDDEQWLSSRFSSEDLLWFFWSVLSF